MVTATPSGTRAAARCLELSRAPYSDRADRLFRGWLTPAYRATIDRVGEWMAAAGMTVRRDAAINLIGRYEGTRPDAPALVIGSHLDSVRDGGAYDGPLGVMLGIECVAALHAEGRRLHFAIEVIGFGDEEGSRFPAAMLGSRAVAGTLAPGAADMADALEGGPVEAYLVAGLDVVGAAADAAQKERARVAGLEPVVGATGPGRDGQAAVAVAGGLAGAAPLAAGRVARGAQVGLDFGAVVAPGAFAHVQLRLQPGYHAAGVGLLQLQGRRGSYAAWLAPSQMMAQHSK